MWSKMPNFIRSKPFSFNAHTHSASWPDLIRPSMKSLDRDQPFGLILWNVIMDPPGKTGGGETRGSGRSSAGEIEPLLDSFDSAIDTVKAIRKVGIMIRQICVVISEQTKLPLH